MTSTGLASSAKPTRIVSASSACSSVNDAVAPQIADTIPSDSVPEANRSRTVGSRANSTVKPTRRPAPAMLIPHADRNQVFVEACP
nr:hypothetical protein [Sphaerisporangium perillae]